jgi:hypothetical protein
MTTVMRNDNGKPDTATANPALLLRPDELARGAIHVDDELGIITAAAVNHVPNKLVAGMTPVEHVKDGNVSIILEYLFAAVLLRHLESFVRINFQKVNIENLRR